MSYDCWVEYHEHCRGCDCECHLDRTIGLEEDQ